MFLFLIADHSSRILYPRHRSLLPKMMNADMDGMFFVFVSICFFFFFRFYMFCGTHIALLSSGKSREAVLRRKAWILASCTYL